MLRDIERKVLRIIYNFNVGRKRLPSLREISVKTGKQEGEIVYIIKKLAEQGYVQWDGQNTRTIQIIKGWEERAGVPESISVIRPNSDYSRFMG